MIVVEFSLSQKSFHKTRLNDMLERNLDNAMRRIQTDYLPVVYCATEELADKFIKGAYDMFKDYQMYKNTNGEMVVIP